MPTVKTKLLLHRFCIVLFRGHYFFQFLWLPLPSGDPNWHHMAEELAIVEAVAIQQIDELLESLSPFITHFRLRDHLRSAMQNSISAPEPDTIYVLVDWKVGLLEKIVSVVNLCPL